ncbi:MAG: hypothetical protein JKY01_06715 [Pseudomonadales bacterium]|nr:hypothetical protein [Pseudomonadales bacterium]
MRIKVVNRTTGCGLLLLSAFGLHAEGALQLETTIIKANTELPNVMYMVPWQKQKENRKISRQRLKLHSLYGDAFDPVYPTESTRR